MRRLLASRADGDEYEIDTLSVGDSHCTTGTSNRHVEPTRLHTAKELVRGAHAHFVGTHPYNGEMPGVLRNALDRLAPPAGDGPLTGKTVAPASASPGARGAVGARASPY